MIIRHSNFDKTVDTIQERNSILNLVDGMIVTVMDASTDPDVVEGKAVYRWIQSDETWVVLYKGSFDSMSFDTEELTITGGKVTASNIPADNNIWDISIVNGDVEVGYPRIEDLTITNGVIDLGVNTYNGLKLRFTYGYGTVVSQLNAVLDTKADISTTYTKTEVDSLVSSAASSAVDSQAVVSASDIDLSTASVFTKTISANTTFTVSNVESSGNISSFMLELTNGGSKTITWFSGIKWASGTVPTLTSAGTDVLCFYTYDGGSTWRGLVAALDIK